MPIVRDPIEPRLSIYHFLAFYLRFLCERAGLSLTQVGKIIGVARSSVCNMEAGRQRPQEDHVAKLTSITEPASFCSFCYGLPVWRTTRTGSGSTLSTKSRHLQ
ncbi:helix-turn-helix domain-containing protein [Actinomadura geliboluensis]|uniref:Helix-turn-helix domain-containing protein n=1 Tax=Actinomadura geliboluensis TaxID=882440 RepID=A0A5S4H7K3_9ACTN|nr:helix-turn-helix domain-containing protein [Actinomadura geliboluensis]